MRRSKIRRLELCLPQLARILWSTSEVNVWDSIKRERKGRWSSGWSERKVALSKFCTLSRQLSHCSMSVPCGGKHDIRVEDGRLKRWGEKSYQSPEPPSSFLTRRAQRSTTPYLTVGLDDKVVVGAEHVDEAVEEHFPHRVVEFELVHHLRVTFPPDLVHFLRVEHTWTRGEER